MRSLDMPILLSRVFESLAAEWANMETVLTVRVRPVVNYEGSWRIENLGTYRALMYLLRRSRNIVSHPHVVS